MKRRLTGDFERIAWPAFAVAACAASFALLWFGRGAGYSLDELANLVRLPELDLDAAIEPYNGHLILTTRVVYSLILEAFGVDYLPFRLLTLATVVLTSGLFFAYARRRIGSLAALAPTLLLLFFGSHVSHVVNGNGFTVLFAIACGLAALLALERDDRIGEIGACALLCLGVVSYTTALPFVVGVGVAVALREDRWRRAWIVAIPVAIYAAWWLQAQGRVSDPQDQVVLSNLLLLPAWGFQILSAVIGSVSGLDYYATLPSAGPALALAALGALGWRLSRGAAPRQIWVAVAILLTTWAAGALTSGLYRLPDQSRYFYSTAVAALLVAVWAASGARWTRTALIVLYGSVALAVGVNLIMLRDGGAGLRGLVPPVRASLGALDAAGAQADPDLDLETATKATSLQLPHVIPAVPGETVVESYRRLSDAFGPLGYPLDELRGRSEEERALADSVLIAALEIEPVAADGSAAGPSCELLGEDGGAADAAQFAPGEGIVIEAEAAPSEVYLRRFTDATATAIGTAVPGEPVELSAPADGAPDPWVVSVSGPATVCDAR